MLQDAIGLAKKNRARVISLDSYEASIFIRLVCCRVAIYMAEKNMQRKEKKRFEEIERLAKENNVKIQTEIVESTMSAHGTIVEYAEEHNVEVIVVGTRGMSGFAKQLLGSTALGVVTYAHCTVMVVKQPLR
jgi:nucleotide-binding universal stress UspA family protein